MGTRISTRIERKTVVRSERGSHHRPVPWSGESDDDGDEGGGSSTPSSDGSGGTGGDLERPLRVPGFSTGRR